MQNLHTSSIARSNIALLALILAGCAHEPPAPEIRYVPLATTVRPVVASECFAADPADPYLAGPTDVELVRHVEDLKGQRRGLKRLRAVCRASLSANGLGPK